MNTLFRFLDCLDKVFFAVQCKHDLHKTCGVRSKKTGLNRVAEMVENTIGEIIFFAILAYGILKGWVEMPEPYLGDGGDFDNYG